MTFDPYVSRQWVLALCLVTLRDNVDSPDDFVRDLVAKQVYVELSLSGPPVSGEINPRDIRLEPGPIVPAKLRILRATVENVTHWHRYIVAEEGGRLFRLGGFQAPELEGVSELIRTKRSNKEEVVEQARLLASLADPEGAVDLVYATGATELTSNKDIARTWLSVAPKHWPVDTTIVHANGAIALRLTVLSRATRSLVSVWVPTAYSFLFGPDGQLQAWSKSEGEPFRSQ